MVEEVRPVPVDFTIVHSRHYGDFNVLQIHPVIKGLYKRIYPVGVFLCLIAETNNVIVSSITSSQILNLQNEMLMTC